MDVQFRYLCLEVRLDEHGCIEPCDWMKLVKGEDHEPIMDCPDCGGGMIKRYREIKCCGEWMECAHFTNTCDHCGCDYNSSGQALAPRHCWGEETGEHPADIARIP